jgi:glycosyltransferase involved in cell wall biosynthesis
MSQPVRVAFVISRLGVGGAERQLISLVNGVDRSRFAPLVVCLKDAGPLRDELAADVEVLALALSRGEDPRQTSRLATILREQGAGLVHCTNFNATFWGRAAALRAGLPCITAEHSTNRRTAKERLLVRLGNALYDRGTAVVVACARAQVSALVAEGCAQTHIEVIHNGIDPARFGGTDARDRLRLEWGVGPHEVAVVAVASLSPQKNHASLIRAAAISVAQGAPIKLVFAGDGVMREELEALSAGLGLDTRVLLLGVRSDIPDVLSAADVVCLPSMPLVETFPLCLLEAMAASRPVIATSVGGVPEMIEDGIEGVLVPPGDDAALASALTELASQTSRREEMGRRGALRVRQEFTLDAMLAAYQQLFERCAGARG